MSEALRARAREARGAGALEGSGLRCARVEHAVCGDELEVDARIEGEHIVALAWRARGCPATLAVAGCLCEAWQGSTVAGAGARRREELQRHGGLAAHERHALNLALDALDRLRGGLS